jgi:hypothetical protein
MKIAKRFVLACTLTGVALMTCGCGSPAVVPKSYKTYTGKEFKIDYPEGWKVEGAGKGDGAWATFSSGNASIEIELGIFGSLIGDMAQSANQLGGIDGSTKGEDVGSPAEDLAPIRKVHEMQKTRYLEDHKYTFESKTSGYNTGMGSARKTPFKGAGTFGGSIHGYLATAKDINYSMRIICTCPEAEWQALKPVFDKVLPTIAPAPKTP